METPPVRDQEEQHAQGGAIMKTENPRSNQIRDDARRFKYDVSRHKMTVRQDDGLYRHVSFSRPGSSVYRFNLVTWPGYLAISGDCDAFMFSRIPDMFDFFRFAGPEYDRTDGINTGYWEEKCTSKARHGGTETFSQDSYLEAIRQDMNGHISGMSLSDAKTVVQEAHEEYVMDPPNSVHEAISIAQNFCCPVTGHHPFTEFWDHNLTEPSYGFQWACRAIQWGIKQYDLAKQGRDQESVDRKILSGAL